MESGGPPVGLGWTSVHSSSNVEQSPEVLIQQYLQQCLEYHEEQERKRRTEAVVDASNISDTGRIPSFVKSSDPLQVVNDEEVPSTDFTESKANDRPTSVSNSASESDKAEKSFAQIVEEGRSRAQAILDKFHQQQTALLGGNFTMNHSVLQTPSQPGIDMVDALVGAFVVQRQKGFQKEAKRKQEALLRNFEYVARRERERAQSLAIEIEASRQRELKMQEQYRIALEERKRRQQESQLLLSQAAIGSHKRNKAENLKRKVFGSQASDSGASVSVYVSGMPTDGSVDENLLIAMFGSYGTIRRVHFYRDKQSGDLKGDGLLVYQLNTGVQARELLSTVCSQMNGVELPCGNILQVEPADSSYQQQRLECFGSHALAPEPGISFHAEKKPDNKEPDTGDDEELDDFFNSLESPK